MTRDMLPLAAYRPAGSPLRTALLMAVLWGVPMTLLLVFTGGGLPMPATLAVGAIAALLFGGLWTYWFRRGLARLMARLHGGDAGLVPPPPPGEYTARVLASLMKSPILAVGGHLYAGPAQLAFVPHTKNRAVDRAPRVLPWAAVHRLESLTRPAPGLARIFSPEPLTYLRVVVADGEWLLRVPEAGHVAEGLQRLKEEHETVIL